MEKWRAEIINEDGGYYCKLFYGHKCILERIHRDFAVDIVKCCNQHDKLVKACRKGLELAQMLNHPYELQIEQAIKETK